MNEEQLEIARDVYQEAYHAGYMDCLYDRKYDPRNVHEGLKSIDN